MSPRKPYVPGKEAAVIQPIRMSRAAHVAAAKEAKKAGKPLATHLRDLLENHFTPKPELRSAEGGQP